MMLKFGALPLAVLSAMFSACATSPPPQNSPAHVRVSFDVYPGDGSAPKHLTRGAISGTPQHVGFFYSVNPDCTSDGLVQLQLKDAPKHGEVSFVKADGYSNFSANSAGHECNTKKSPGVRVIYTSVQDFVGTDQFTVQGIGPHGTFLQTEYAVKVVAPSG